MSSSGTCPQEPQLCEVCSTNDFKNIAHPATLYTKTTLEEQASSHRDLGTPSEISERSGRCVFCNLIFRRIQSNCPDVDGECHLLYGVTLCISAFHRTGSDQDVRHDRHAHTTVAFVQLHPENALDGPTQPWEIRSHLEQGTQQLLLLQAASSFNPPRQYLQPGQNLSDLLSEKDMLKSVRARRVSPEADLSLLSRWLHLCESSHRGSCFESLSGGYKETRVLPAFVIDVRSSSVVETPTNCRYVALSYVWGAVATLKHVMANSSALRVPGSLTCMKAPRTIRDSISLVRRMGEQYLWVDALCIVQDDARMQQSQIARMHKIYSEAVFTIVAAGGDSADSGLSGIHPSTRLQTQETILLPDCNLTTLLYEVDIGVSGSKITNSVWIQRAWTMQEMLFSRRCLIFTEDQIYWRCGAAVWLEEISLESMPATNLKLLPGDVDYQLPTQPLQHQEYFELYQDLLTNYRQRRLSCPSDLLNAFSGVCSALSAVQKDVFIWGHPRTRFSLSLSWYFYGHHTRNHVCTTFILRDGSAKKVPFPSWSWTAWGGKKYLPWINIMRKRRQHDLIYHPVTEFWLSDEYDTLVRIEELTSDDSHSGTRAKQLPWQGIEWQLPSDAGLSGMRHPTGALHFWASVATTKVYRVQRPEPEKSSFYSSLAPPVLGSTVHIEHGSGRSDGQSWGEESYEVKDEVDMVFVVVCRATQSVSAPKLLLIAVEWRDGVAYRLGSAEGNEDEWTALQNRQRKFVTLG